jgi:CRISPR/Cas system-associated exonuclease Cas4 (RecB family)
MPHSGSIRPTSVEKFTRCPQKWYYEDVEGWREPGVGPSVPIIIGTAVHAGMAALWRGQDESSARVLDVFKALWSDSEPGREAAEDLALKVVLATMRWCQQLGEVEVVAVEEPLGDPWQGTPDLITRETGGLVIWDWKYSHEVKPEWLHYRLEHPEHSHQFQHYIWAVQEKYHESVSLFRKVVIVGLPKVQVAQALFVPDPMAQQEWLRQAKVKWHTMAMMKAGGMLHGGLVYRNENGCKPFGDKWPCPMWRACWECHGNREQMAQFYVKGDPR